MSKQKKNISKCRLLKFLPSMLSVYNKPVFYKVFAENAFKLKWLALIGLIESAFYLIINHYFTSIDFKVHFIAENMFND